MKVPSPDAAAAAATPLLVIVTVICHLAPSPATVRRWLAAVLRWPRRALLAILERCDPDEGKHSPRATTTPAPELKRAQESRPGDPLRPSSAVRAGATPTQPNPKTPAATPSQQPEGAASPSRPVASSPTTPGEGATPTLTDLFWPAPRDPGAPRMVLPAPASATLGQGRHPFGGNPWEGIVVTQPVLWPRDGERPYRRGHQRRPIAVIRNGSVSLHPTGVMPEVPELSADDQLYAAAMRHAAASQRWAGADDTDTLRRTLAGLRAL